MALASKECCGMIALALLAFAFPFIAMGPLWLSDRIRFGAGSRRLPARDAGARADRPRNLRGVR
jgi:hypothetical protein